jgi:hypothetical protein
MDLRVILLTASIVMLTACAGEVPPPQPAPPTDRNFTATVNDQPVVGGTASFECLIRSDGKDHQSHYLLTFTDDLAHTIRSGSSGAAMPGRARHRRWHGHHPGTGVRAAARHDGNVDRDRPHSDRSGDFRQVQCAFRGRECGAERGDA